MIRVPIDAVYTVMVKWIEPNGLKVLVEHIKFMPADCPTSIIHATITKHQDGSIMNFDCYFADMQKMANR